MTNVNVINGVSVTVDKSRKMKSGNYKLILVVPSSMTGTELAQWQKKNKSAIDAIRSSSDASEDCEGDSYARR